VFSGIALVTMLIEAILDVGVLNLVILRVGSLRAERSEVVNLAGHFLFTCSELFTVGCII